MNNVLFKGTNISNNEGLKMLNKYTEGLEKISSHEDKTFIYTEFGNEEDFEKGGNKIIVDIYYKENLDIEYMNITEVFLLDDILSSLLTL